MTNYVKKGDTVTRTAPSGGVVSGTAYLIGSLLVVAQTTKAQGESFEGLAVGVVTLPKATGEAWTEGAKLYWDNNAGNVTTTSSGNSLIGCADAGADSSATRGNVRLDGVVR